MQNNTRDLLERLGATSDLYIPLGTFPDIIVYVEGKEDKPIVDDLIKWYRVKYSEKALPSTLV